MKKLSVLLFVLFTTIGLMAQTADLPSAGDGSEGNPYQIATLNNLYWITQNTSRWGSHYVQTADIDASATSGWDSGAGWTPIGNNTIKFTGSYNGQGHTINGLFINRGSSNYQGFFGFLSGIIIQNLGVINVNIKGFNCVGGLVGHTGIVSSSSVNDCYSTGSVSGTDEVGGLVGINGYTGGCASTVSNCYSTCSVDGVQYIGGLVGMSMGLSSSISSSYSSGSVSGTYHVGGLVGINKERSLLSECHSSGSVSGNSSVGGLVGCIATYATMSNCYCTGSVNGTSAVGGLAGLESDHTTVLNCYSMGNVTRSSGTNTSLGGFVGINSTGCSIEYCYSTGGVSCGSSTDKGFLGSNAGTCTSNFFDSQTSGQSSSVGATAKTTAEMKTHMTFTTADWDFEIETANGTNDYWDIDYSASINNGYPFLSWQNGGDISLPVELVSFSARCEGQSIVLEWATESEVDNLGFRLERSGEGGAWVQIASYKTHNELKGQSNTSSRTEYAFTDNTVEFGEDYSYRLSDVNTRGEITVHPSLSIKMDVLHEKTEMENAYPNPFNLQTYISYHLSENNLVQISVFDILGRQVKTLYNSYQLAGIYHTYWNGTNENNTIVPTGTYIIRMQTENITQIQKVVLMK